MPAEPTTGSQKRILLTGVFGPYGVDDEYGRKENIMELFHNQVTKAQGPASFRFHHRSFGLYFLAENVDAPVTVLDFPSKRRFQRELARGYDLVGISFIAPNFLKAQEMARMVRQQAPGAEIVLGGHGSAIPGIEDQIDCDHVVRGEGIRWLREHLGQDPDAPIVHPTLPSTERQSILGVPVPGPTASLLVPGVGCVNGCSFCCTSHFFDKQYSSFLGTGLELFETASRIADARKTDAFFIMDENFLKNRDRARELLAEMERNRRFFRFHIFSSAEAIQAFGLDEMVRLGVTTVWIGFESQSRQSMFEKNIGIDAPALVRGLRQRGIAVLASGILCMEHHTPENIQEDIDFLTGLEPDLAQFMLLTPMPVTQLYRDHQARGILRTDLPLEECHGQTELAYHHEAFGPGEPERWIHHAFGQDYRHNSSSMYRVTETALNGYRNLAETQDRDECLEARFKQYRRQAREYSLMLPVLVRHPVNPLEARRARALAAEATRLLGRRTALDGVMGLAVRALAARWRLRIRFRGDGIQPRTLLNRYPAGRSLPRRCDRMAPGTASTQEATSRVGSLVGVR